MRFERLRDVEAKADLDAIVALETDAFTNPWPRETLVWEMRNSDVTRIYLLRDDGGRIVAFSVCWVIFDELHINTLAVAASERRKGLATELLKEVLAEARREG